MAGLGQCASLHTLRLSYRSGVTDVAGLGQCAPLRTLDLRGCSTVANFEVFSCVEIMHSESDEVKDED